MVNIADDLIIHGSDVKKHDRKIFAVLDKQGRSG